MCIAADDDEEEDALARLSIDRLVRFEGGIFLCGLNDLLQPANGIN